MTKAEAVKLFHETHPEKTFISKLTGRIDHVMRSQAWNDFTDMLCKNREITQKQYDTWDNPF